ncbi:ComEC/Rec2 family competence protein [Burkholderia gladioli]|uniref:ComEC/Rec2 family competence protein n=1 Tax=Burkholderia gladioli TaxID=28095 RepID=UPI0024462CE2|nr:MBL fold metallo-hydrolase [Burkholderia gladioli]
MNLIIFDVEHGACALLTCDNGSRIMIDCGHNGVDKWRPGNYLSERNIKNLEQLFITNYDEDHVSGLPNLLEKVTVQTLSRNTSVTASDLTDLKRENGIGPGMIKLVGMASTYTEAVTSPPEFPGVEKKVYFHRYPTFKDENNLSMVVSLKISGINFLFPGDLEKAGWKLLLENNNYFAEEVKKTQVLIASHHGRENGIYEPLFDQFGCKPEIVVISDKGYAYDTQLTVPYYRSKVSGIDLNGKRRHVLTTRKDGCIRFTFPMENRAEVTINYNMDVELSLAARLGIQL